MLRVTDITLVPEGCRWRLAAITDIKYIVHRYDLTKNTVRYIAEHGSGSVMSHDLTDWLEKLVPEINDYGVQMSQARSILGFLLATGVDKKDVYSLITELDI